MKTKHFVVYVLLIVYALTILYACSNDDMKYVNFVFPEYNNYEMPYIVAIETGKSINDYGFDLPVPYRLGYYLIGWEAEGKTFSKETVINKNYTVNAIWQKYDIQILSAHGGIAELANMEEWVDLGTCYNINYIANEGFYLSKWLIQYEGEEAYSSYDEDLSIIMNSYKTSCEVTPVFTDKTIPVIMDINTYGGNGSDGGAVEYPEFSVGERNFDIKIEAAEGYYILNYGFMQTDSDNSNIINYIKYGFISPFEIYSLSAQMHFRDTAFGPGEEKWFCVNFVEKSQAQVIKALMIEGDSTFSVSVDVIMIGGIYQVTALERDNSTFLYWRDSEGNILSDNRNYSYTVSDNGERTIYAIYSKD